MRVTSPEAPAVSHPGTTCRKLYLIVQGSALQLCPVESLNKLFQGSEITAMWGEV